MTIYGKDDKAYVRYGRDTMLCIGLIADLEGKPDSAVTEAILEAVAIARFNELKPGKLPN